MEQGQTSSQPRSPKQRYATMSRAEQLREVRQQWSTICSATDSFLEHLEESGEVFPDEQLYPRVWVAVANLAVNMLGFDSETPFRDIGSVSEALNDRLGIITGRAQGLQQNDRELSGARG